MHGAREQIHNWGMKELPRLGLLMAAVAIAYGNTLLNDFAQDDQIYILENHAVTAHSLHELIQPNYFSRVFRPVTFATFSVNWALRANHPFSYHLLNILLHAVVTCLLCVLLRSLLEPLPHAATVALIAAWLFAVHPIHTEAVAAIAGRSELLAAGFLLGAWLLHLHDRHLLALLCFVLALLSKESAVVFFPLVLLGDFARGELKPALRYASIAAVTALYVGLFWKLQGGRFGIVIPFLDNPLGVLPPTLRMLNALRVAWKYFGLQVYPGSLSCDYSYSAILLYSNWRVVPSACLALLVVLLWIWSLYARKRAWAIAGTIYLVGFAATANLFFPIGTIMGERLAYFPSAGFCLLAALLWVHLKRYNRPLAIAVLAVIVAGFAVRTVVRNRDWRNNFTLYSAALLVVPQSAKMHYAIATQYALQGQPELARKEFQTSLRLYPDYPEALESFGLLEANTGQDQESRRLLQAALALAQKGSLNYNFAVVNLAGQLIKLGDNDQALKLLDQDIANSPDYARAWANRALIRYRQGDLASARSDAQTALRLDPGNSQAQALLSRLNASPSLTFPK
jgi:protein O-mannosyl-transferase